MNFIAWLQAGQFVAWVVTQYEQCKKIAESTTAHGQLNDVSVNIEGNRVYLIFEFHTGDASGQNMVTIATNEVFNYICAHSPIKAQEAFLDGNLSGDKKPNTCTLKHVRGKKVSAEINLSKDLVEKYLHTTPEKMVKFGQMTTTGASLSGGIGVNAHYANALAALYTACGQDIACVAESAIGITRMEMNMDGGLYACVTLPNIMVGTVVVAHIFQPKSMSRNHGIIWHWKIKSARRSHCWPLLSWRTIHCWSVLCWSLLEGTPKTGKVNAPFSTNSSCANTKLAYGGDSLKLFFPPRHKKKPIY